MPSLGVSQGRARGHTRPGNSRRPNTTSTQNQAQGAGNPGPRPAGPGARAARPFGAAAPAAAGTCPGLSSHGEQPPAGGETLGAVPTGATQSVCHLDPTSCSAQGPRPAGRRWERLPGKGPVPTLTHRLVHGLLKPVHDLPVGGEQTRRERPARALWRAARPELPRGLTPSLGPSPGAPCTCSSAPRSPSVLLPPAQTAHPTRCWAPSLARCRQAGWPAWVGTPDTGMAGEQPAGGGPSSRGGHSLEVGGGCWGPLGWLWAGHRCCGGGLGTSGQVYGPSRAWHTGLPERGPAGHCPGHRRAMRGPGGCYPQDDSDRPPRRRPRPRLRMSSTWEAGGTQDTQLTGAWLAGL